MLYTVYQITNTVNGKIYIGTHQTLDPYDEYLGSGRYIKNAVALYGKENFVKTILAVFSTPREMFEMEAELVNPVFCKRPDVYNLVAGGLNTIEHVNQNLDQFRPPAKRVEWAKAGRRAANAKNAHLLGSKAKQEKMKDPEYASRIGAAIIAGHERTGFTRFKGKRHTEDSKRIIGEKNSISQQGSSNSQFGKKWITNPLTGTNKSVHVDSIQEYLDNGWVLGRKLNK